MNRKISRIVVLGAFPCLMVAAVAVTTLSAGSPWTKVDVPFAFRAGDSDLAAGTYRVLARTEKDVVVIKLEGPDGASQVPVSTRLARTAASSASMNLVFDRVDGQRRLAEVWIPGEDGYLVRGNVAEKKHDHEILTGEAAE